MCVLKKLGNRLEDKFFLLIYVGISLEIGDIVIDTTTGDVGLLVERYSLFDDLVDDEYGGPLNLFAWQIFWAGPLGTISESESRYQPYTESGLLNLIKTGTFLVKKRNMGNG